MKQTKTLKIWGLTLVALIVVCALVLGTACSKQDSGADTKTNDTSAMKSKLSEAPFYVLLVGDDTRKGTAVYKGDPNAHADLVSHSDIMTLVRVDPINYELTLVSVPRDTEVTLNGSIVKLNEVYLQQGIDSLVSYVEDLTGVSIEHYLITTFVNYEKLVDAIGGITVDVPMTISFNDPVDDKTVTVSGGDSQKLDGEQALVFARVRKAYGEENQDALRQINVRKSIASIIEATAATDSDTLAKYTGSLLENTTTDFDSTDLTNLINDFAANAGKIKIYSCSGPYEGGIEETTQIWLVTPDPTSWSKLMAAVNAGKDPSGIVPLPEFPSGS